MKINYKKLLKIELAIIVILCSLPVVANWVNSTPSVKDAVAMATTVKPETFTELYFEDHTNLPSKIQKGKTYYFTFTVHNLENRDMDYQYNVYINTDDQSKVIESGTFNLKDGNYIRFTKNFSLAKTIKSKIVVELANKNQHIEFWIDK